MTPKKQPAPSGPVTADPPQSIDTSDALMEITHDLRWSWDHSADDIWRAMDPEMWDLTRNPKLILLSIAPEKVQRVMDDPGFRERVHHLTHQLREEREAALWFQRKHADAALTSVAYFSLEFMLGEALPIYSGGLGNVAGDQLKAASDLGVPVTGVGLLYQQGYFRQMIAADGSQEALYPINDPGQLPITPVRDEKGQWVRFQVPFPHYPIWVRAWKAQVGRLQLYLLDSNDPANPPLESGITAQLYGGGPETRIAQEFILGIGGWRLLRRLGLNPEVCHLNEGHAAFVILERAAAFMQSAGCSFDVALAVTRAGNLFTTHTPVAAGFDAFAPNLVQRYFDVYTRDGLGIGFKDLLALGRRDPTNANEPFSMAYLAVRGSGAVNGVSRLHGAVSRSLFASLFPRWPHREVPIGHVTNGIHVDTWGSAASETVWTKYGGCQRWQGETEKLEAALRQVPDEELWSMRQAARRALVARTRKRYVRQSAMWGAGAEEIAQARRVLNAEALTLGFARRFATYKRPTLLLQDPERMVRMLSNFRQPVQLIVAGKAHPADQAGQAMIRRWIEFSRRPEVAGRVVFLSDYDMLLTEQLVGGVDVWINTPRRPWEACGTSGMKVLANGGLNLSELDGWWAEAYTPGVGWALGDGKERGEDPAWDALEADSLYTLLEKEIIPLFYRRTRDGIPVQWLNKVRESMATLTARFSSNRAVREYTESYYLPAAEAYRRRSAREGEVGRRLAAWQDGIRRKWPDVKFGDVDIRSDRDFHTFRVRVFSGGLVPEAIAVQLVAEPLAEGERTCWPMTRDPSSAQEDGDVYTVRVPARRPASDFTARVIPEHPEVTVPLENPSICWQR